MQSPIDTPSSMLEPSPRNLTGGRLLARNTLWNILGQGAPLLVAIFAIPVLIKALGTDRFGVLTLAWMVIGYFSLFDLGLGRALTQLVAERFGMGRGEEVPPLAWTALTIMLVLGMLATLTVIGISPWLVYSVLKIPEWLHAETLQSFYLLAFAIPFVISTSGLRGILEAQQRFDLVNAVRIPMGVFTFLGPLTVLPFSDSLVPVISVLLGFRVVAWLVHLLLCLKSLPSLREEFSIRADAIPPLIRLGGWMTVTNIVGPVMVYMDRFLIGSVVSITAVAYYVTPYEVVTKLWLLPGALVGVLFPAFSISVGSDQARAAGLYWRGVKYTFIGLFPLTLVIVTFAREGLGLWLGAEFAENSTRVLQWLAVGVFFNSLAYIPFALVQSAGRSDLTAKLHLIELPVYLLALWWLLEVWGVVGAAIAWSGRVVLDTIALFILAGWRVPEVTLVFKRDALIMITTLVLLAMGGVLRDMAIKTAFLSVVLAGFGLVIWFLFISVEERAILSRALKT